MAQARAMTEHAAGHAQEASTTGRKAARNKARRRFSSSSTSTSSHSSSESITSLFESSLALLGSLPVASGSSRPHKPVIHHSRRFGNIKLYLSNVQSFDEIRLQSHLVWPSSPWMADMMEDGTVGVRGESVLELGAGSALLSLMAAKLEAKSVLATDYPGANILETIRKNVDVNLTDSSERDKVSISGLDWTDEAALSELVASHPAGFTRILAADTLWLEHVNADQIRVMAALLAKTNTSRIFIVAGLHTGRRVIKQFLEFALAAGFEIVRAREVDRTGAAVEDSEEEHRSGPSATGGFDWKALMAVSDDGQTETVIYEGIEEERRRWLLSAELKWGACWLSTGA